MKINKAHLLFEQSGTFKRAFLNLGIPAQDYDIADDFGETDNKIEMIAPDYADRFIRTYILDLI